MTLFDATAQRRGAHRAHHYKPHYLLYFYDVAVLVFSAWVLYFPCVDRPSAFDGLYLSVVLVAVFAYSFFGFTVGIYDWKKLNQYLKQPLIVFGGVIVAFGGILIFAFVFKLTGTFSRLWLGSWFVVFCAYILISRVILIWYLSGPERAGFVCRRAVIIGAGENGLAVLEQMSRYNDHSLQLLGFVDDWKDKLSAGSLAVPILGTTQVLEQLVQEYYVDVVIVALPWGARDRINEITQKLRSWSVDVYLAPDQLAMQYADRPVHRLAGMHLLNVQDRPISEWKAVVKRIEDLCIAIPAVVILSPLLALIALAIRLESRGDVLFVQDRYGFNNNLIPVYKFRSMYTNLADVDAERLTSKNDPRVTRVGRIIRKLSLDELPQFFNVILGDMSIVGPRPHATKAKAAGEFYQDVVDGYASRHRVKPGITGWAQCNGWRGETDTREKIEKRVECDLYYIENWSVFLDLLIIVKTMILLFRNDQNAY